MNDTLKQPKSEDNVFLYPDSVNSIFLQLANTKGRRCLN